MRAGLIHSIPTYRMTMEQVKTMVFRYVFTYYNQMRVYTSNPDGLPSAVSEVAYLGIKLWMFQRLHFS